MFSQIFQLEEKYYTTFQLEVNGELINPNDCNEWETILSYTNIWYSHLSSHNNEVEKTIIRQSLAKLNLYNLYEVIQPNLTNSTLSDNKLNTAYKSFIEGVFGTKIQDVKLYLCEFVFEHNTYRLISKKIVIPIEDTNHE